MTRTWSTEQIAAVAAQLWARDPDGAFSNFECATFAAELLDACADESDRRKAEAAKEAVK